MCVCLCGCRCTDCRLILALLTGCREEEKPQIICALILHTDGETTDTSSAFCLQVISLRKHHRKHQDEAFPEVKTLFNVHFIRQNVKEFIQNLRFLSLFSFVHFDPLQCLVYTKYCRMCIPSSPSEGGSIILLWPV